jgi:hypothetical protein
VNVFCFLSPKGMGVLNGLGVNGFVGHDLPKNGYLNGLDTATAQKLNLPYCGAVPAFAVVVFADLEGSVDTDFC